MSARAPSWFMARKQLSSILKVHFIVNGTMPQLYHHLALQNCLLLWSLRTPRGSSRFSDVQDISFSTASPGPSLELYSMSFSLTSCLDSQRAGRKKTHPITSPTGSFFPIIPSVGNTLSFSPPDRNQVYMSTLPHSL